MSSDSIMLDSPAQTPTPKGHPPPPLTSGNLAADVAMIMDDSNTGLSAAAASPAAWDTKKYREELSQVRSRLQHQHFDYLKLRDPLNKPLVTGPRNLPADVQDRMRKLFQECVSH